MSDFSLLDLFREEVSGCTQVLNEGLVALEQAPADVRLIEPLMRAAHSIKGAARVVAVEPAVKVAHAMEDCLVKAQKGEFALTSAAIDILLRGVDMLSQMAGAVGPEFAAWEAKNSPSIAELLQRLTAAQKADPTPPPAAVSEPPKVAEPEIVPVIQPPAQPPPQPKPAPADAEERVVRVTAQSLTRLMGLAGESLVEARWLQPFAASLLRLKRLQAQLGDDLGALGQTLPEHAASQRSRDLLADAFEPVSRVSPAAR